MFDLDPFSRRLRAALAPAGAAGCDARGGRRVEMVRLAAQEASLRELASAIFDRIVRPRVALVTHELVRCRYRTDEHPLSATVLVDADPSLEATMQLRLSIDRRGPDELAVVVAPDFDPILFDLPGWVAMSVRREAPDLAAVQAFVEECLIVFVQSVVALAADPRLRGDRRAANPVGRPDQRR